MKKTFLTIALCTMVALAGCGKKDTPKVPKSISIYQKIQLTPEQNKKVADIRAAQRVRMEAIRKEMENNRVKLLGDEATKNLTEAQKKANLDKYREASIKTREKIEAERAAYDKSFGSILDEKQQKVYQKYLKQRDKEKAEREKVVKK